MTSLAEPAAALLVILAAGVAVDRALDAPAHRPLAGSLCLAMLEPMRPDEGTAARLLCLGLPALSAWLAVRVFQRVRLLALCAAALVLVVGSGAWRWRGWDVALLASSGASLAVQAASALMVRRRLWLADRCVLVLAAGDVAAMLGPLGERAPVEVQRLAWWIVQWQAASVAIVLCALHLHQALVDRGRRG